MNDSLINCQILSAWIVALSLLTVLVLARLCYVVHLFGRAVSSMGLVFHQLAIFSFLNDQGRGNLIGLFHLVRIGHFSRLHRGLALDNQAILIGLAHRGGCILELGEVFADFSSL